MRAPRPLRRERPHDDLLAKLEQLHILAVEAEAFFSALDAANTDSAWWLSTRAERQRTLNRLGCFSEELRKRLNTLLRESEAVVNVAMGSREKRRRL